VNDSDDDGLLLDDDDDDLMLIPFQSLLDSDSAAQTLLDDKLIYEVTLPNEATNNLRSEYAFSCTHHPLSHPLSFSVSLSLLGGPVVFSQGEAR